MSAVPALRDADAPAPFGAVAFADAMAATPAQLADLERFRALLVEWNERMNLVGPSAIADFWRRHAFDSAQLIDYAPSALRWADLGPGAGFPGVVLAILLKGRPGAVVHLIESMAKRCGFLRAVVAELALPAEVHNARAETLALAPVDVVCARACAPLTKVLGYALPYLKTGAIGLFPKGQDVAAELAEARRSWRFKARLIGSRSGDGSIVRVEGLKHV